MIVAALDEVAKEGYEQELDLFYARACLDLLVRSNELAKTKHVLEAAKVNIGSSPLINFVDFLIAAIEEDDFELVKSMALEDYAIVLKRDGTLVDKVDKICQKAFNKSIKPVNPMQQMMA